MLNIIILDKLTGQPISPQREPITGDWVRETLSGEGRNGTDLITEFEYQEPVSPLTIDVLTFSSITVTDATTNAVIESGGKYYAQTGFTPVVTLTLSDLTVNIPLVKIPFVKYADDRPTETELYLTGSVISGVLACAGEAVESGNYKVTDARTNRALDRLAGGSAPFHVEFDELDFLV